MPAKVKTPYLCKTCNEEFEGGKTKGECPNCGETVNLTRLELNTGIPVSDISNATGNPFGRPITIVPSNVSPPDDDMEHREVELKRREYEDTIRDQRLLRAERKRMEEDKAKKQAEIELLKQEQILGAMKSGDVPFQTQSQQQQMPGGGPSPSTPYNPNSQMFFTNLLRMEEDERNTMIEMLDNNPNLALAFSMMMNPQSIDVTQMNPMQGGMFPGMMQQQPQPSMTEVADSVVQMAANLMSMVPQSVPQDNSRLEEEMKELRQENRDLMNKMFEIRLQESSKGDESDVSEDTIRKIIREEAPKPVTNDPITATLEKLVTHRDLLVNAGLAQLPDAVATAEETVDDYIKKEEFKWKKERQKQELDLEGKKIQEKISKQAVAAKVIAAGMERAMQAGNRNDEEEEEEPIPRRRVPVPVKKTPPFPQPKNEKKDEDVKARTYL